MTRAELIVTMPACNERAAIAEVCREWLGVLDRVPGARLIVVDDGSVDGTAERLDELARGDKRLGVLHQPNRGHGAAVMAAYRAALDAGCCWVFQTDSDGEISAREFGELWTRRGGANFVLGERGGRPWARVLVTSLFTAYAFALFGVWIGDPNVPFRLMRSEALERLLPQVPEGAFAPNLFLSVLAALAQLRTERIPVLQRRRGRKLASVRLAAGGLRSLVELAVLRFRRGWSLGEYASSHGL